MKKTDEERIAELDQRIRKAQQAKKKIITKQQNEARKKRNHALIVIGSTFLAHYPTEQQEVLAGDDESIVNWVNAKFVRKRQG